MRIDDAAVRATAFAWLAEQLARHGDVLPWSLLLGGFEFDGQRVPLLSLQGIFKPRLCELPLSIRTSVASPYDDELVDDRLAYAYVGTDPSHWQNVGLRRAFQERVPLVYLYGVAEGRYMPVWPSYIVGDEPGHLRFWVQAEVGTMSLGGATISASLGGASLVGEEFTRQYATRLMKQRLHQRGFSERVMEAYKVRCCICRLGHRELLDAAHILPDSDGGKPVVSNGFALCKIHHASFDAGVLGVHPSTLRVRIRPDVLDEIDGPMLRHGLQELDGERIWVPRSAGKKPDAASLRWRWERFERRVC